MEAWSRLYQEHFDRVFRKLCLHVRDPMLAEDLTQETFANALASLKTLRRPASFVGWLGGVAINCVRVYWRRERSTDAAMHRLLQIRDCAPGPDLEQQAMSAAKVRVLYDILDTLPMSLREVFVLKDLEGLSQREIAEQLGITENNAAVRATRARTRVREELVRLGWVSPKEGG